VNLENAESPPSDSAGFAILEFAGSAADGALPMHIHRRVRIDASPPAVWRCLTETSLLKQWVSNLLEETPEGPQQSGIGAVSNIQMREGSRVVTYRSIVTEWEPKQKLAIRLSGGSLGEGMEMDVIYELNQEDLTGVVLDYDATVPLKGFFFKLLAPIIWLGMAGSSKQDLAKLKALAPTVSA
jgi:uncharacterized protein YndB with AHSA1/START domain